MGVGPMEVKDETHRPMVFVVSVSVQAVAQKVVSVLAHYHVAVGPDAVPSMEYQRTLSAINS